MKILITGISGFVGNAVGQVLSHQNQIYGLTRNQISCNYFTPIFADLSCENFTKLLPAKIDCVIHFAQSSRYRDFPEGVSDMNRINIHSSLDLLEWSRINGVKKFIFASTANVYGNGQRKFSETDQTDPISYYGASKLSIEKLSKEYSDFFQIDILRLFTVYGPKQTGMLIPNIAKKVNNGGLITLAEGKGISLSPIFIQDVCSIIERLILIQSNEKYRLINLCGDQIVYLEEIVRIIENIIEKKANIQVTGQKKIVLAGNNSYLKKIIGNHQFIDIKKGLNIFLKES